MSLSGASVTETTKTTPALKALLEGFIDYAGLFPPAKLELKQTLDNYDRYQNSEYSWLLRWVVVRESDLKGIPESYNGLLSTLAEVEQARAAVLESTGIVDSSRPCYCEVPLAKLTMLDDVKKSACFAKVRCGGLTPEAIPSTADLSAFIARCAALKLPFKATAGLHHPVRSIQPLTYETDAPRAMMHGFLNVLLASSFAWHGEANIEAIISETDPTAFRFDERAHWRQSSLSHKQIQDARLNFVHAIGSCSFDEPVHDLQALGLL